MLSRDRFDELLEFAPAMDAFLTEAGIDHEIYVINQADKYRFNRASLINVGYIVTEKAGFDYFAMHDVDLIPTTHQIKYDFPTKGPVHLARYGLKSLTILKIMKIFHPKKPRASPALSLRQVCWWNPFADPCRLQGLSGNGEQVLGLGEGGR